MRPPAFRHCDRGMLTSTLRMAIHPDGHGIRPRSLQVAAISALSTEVAKGNAHLSQIAIQEYNRAATAHGMGDLFAQIRASADFRVEIRTIGFSDYNRPMGVAKEPPAFFRNRGGSGRRHFQNSSPGSTSVRFCDRASKFTKIA